MTKDQVEWIKRMYQRGCRVKCIQMDDPWNPIPSDMTGTVEVVDDIGQIHVQWDNGRTLALVPGIDQFEKI